MSGLALYVAVVVVGAMLIAVLIWLYVIWPA